VNHTAQLKTALDNLLKVAAFKFLTSIAGLLTSLFLTIGIRVCNGKLRHAYTKLNTVLERNLLYESQESLLQKNQRIALSQLEMSARSNDLFRIFTESYAQEVAQKTALAFNSIVRVYAKNFFDRLDPAFVMLGTRLGEVVQKTLSQLVIEFSETLKANTHVELQNMIEALQTSQKALGDVEQCAVQTKENYLALLGQMQQTMESVLEHSSKHFTHAVEEASEALTTQQQESAKQFDETLENAAEMICRMTDNLGNALAAQAKSYEDSVSSMGQKTEEHLKQQSAVLLTSFQEVNTDLQKASQNMLASQEQFVQLLKDTTQRVQSGVQNIAVQLHGMSEEVEQRFAHALDNNAQQIDAQIIKITTTLSAAADTFTQSMGDMNKALGAQTEQQIQLFKEAGVDGGALLKAQIESLQQQMNQAHLGLQEGVECFKEELHQGCAQQIEFFKATLTQLLARYQDGLEQTSKKSAVMEEEVCATIESAAAAFKASLQDACSGLDKFIQAQNESRQIVF
ncbi:MAG: hypothetical protein IK079_05390, partial [Desulfovibrio sp.]|nr:hypothetical protein [Desulfovibrio sp.]